MDFCESGDRLARSDRLGRLHGLGIARPGGGDEIWVDKCEVALQTGASVTLWKYLRQEILDPYNLNAPIYSEGEEMTVIRYQIVRLGVVGTV